MHPFHAPYALWLKANSYPSIIRDRVEGPIRVGIVLVEVLADLLRDDLDVLSLELLHWLVRGGNATVAGEEDLTHAAVPHLPPVVLHVVHAEGHVGLALV